MLKNSIQTLVFGFALYVGSCHAFAKEPLSEANLIDALPESTDCLVYATNMQSVYALISKSSTAEHLGGPVWQNVTQSQKKTLTGSLLNPRPWIGLDWNDVSNIEQPGAVVSFLDPAGASQWMAIAKLGKQAKDHVLVRQWLANHAGAVQAPASKLGSSTTLFVAPKAKNSDVEECLAIGEQWTCIASSAKAIEGWLTKHAGSPKTPGIKKVIDTVGDREVAFWISPWSVFRGHTEKQEPKAFQSGTRFGLDGIEEIAGKLVPPSTDPAWRLDYQIKVKLPLAKALALFSFKSGDAMDIPKWMGRNADGFTLSYVDIKPWFQGVSHVIDELIDEETPGGFGDLLDSILTDPEGPKIDIRKELIYRQGPYMTHSEITVPDSKKPGQFLQNHIWASVLQDPKSAIATLNKVFDGDDDIKKEQIGEAACWYTTNGESLFVSLSNSDNQSISIAAIDGNMLYLSTDFNWFRELLAKSKPVTKAEALDPISMRHFQSSPSAKFSMRQQLHLGSWARSSWSKLPEKAPEKKEAYRINLPSFVITKLLLPGISQKEIPKWESVQPVLGTLTHTAIRDESIIQGQIWLDTRSEQFVPAASKK